MSLKLGSSGGGWHVVVVSCSDCSELLSYSDNKVMVSFSSSQVMVFSTLNVVILMFYLVVV